MKKSLLLTALLAASCVLGAQETGRLGREDVMNAFKEYNPAALQKAAVNPAYGELMNKLADAYSAPATPASRSELIALVKNFDNSIRLQAARNIYFEGRTLQTVSGAELDSLEEQTQKEIFSIVQSVFKNTVFVQELRIKDYKRQIKEVKKDASLSKEEKLRRRAALETQIRSVKQELKKLKTGSKQKIRDTAAAYFGEIRADFEASQRAGLSADGLGAEQSSSRDIKAGNKKPVAK